MGVIESLKIIFLTTECQQILLELPTSTTGSLLFSLSLASIVGTSTRPRNHMNCPFYIFSCCRYATLWHCHNCLLHQFKRLHCVALVWFSPSSELHLTCSPPPQDTVHSPQSPQAFQTPVKWKSFYLRNYLLIWHWHHVYLKYKLINSHVECVQSKESKLCQISNAKTNLEYRRKSNYVSKAKIRHHLSHWCFRNHHLPHWVGAEQGSSSLSSPSQGLPPGPGAGFVHDLRKE